jgi:chromosome segregation ATPase
MELKDIFERYAKETRNFTKTLKGGEGIMETKSRYEVIADLEKQKRALIFQRDNLDDELKRMEKELKEMKRDIEDKEEEIQDYKSKMGERKETIKELIASVDKSLDRFGKLQEKKSS